MTTSTTSVPRQRATTTTTTTATTTTAATSEQTAPVTSQLPLPVTPVAWYPCGTGLQCGSVTVPLDYSRPQSTEIEIAVERHPAEIPTERIGSLVINPGGPGGSGINDLPTELSVLTPALLDRFDIVSFDPRGVQRSSPVTCPSYPGESSPGPVPDPVPLTRADENALLANDRAFAAQCQHASGSILPYVGAIDAARDLDRIRQALGDATLTFVGHSYGTLLGATYAQMFPSHVRAMVLDGAIDPDLGTDEMIIEQADSFEKVLDGFFAWCTTSPSCAWHPRGSPSSAVLALIARSRVHPLAAAGGQTAGPGDIYDALLASLYSQSSWPTLSDILAQVVTGNGSGAAQRSGNYRAGGSSNASEAEQAIDCLDHPVSRDLGSYPALAARAAKTAPIFGPLLAWALLDCAVWPTAPTRAPAATTAVGAPPILVVGTTDDPATPYEWAVHLAEELRHGFLLTWHGEDHVAYFYSACVRAAAQSYLISGTLPRPGAACYD